MDLLYFGALAVTAFFALGVVAYVVYFAIKHRDETREEVGAPVVGWMPHELGWALIPFFVSVGILVWASIVFFHIVQRPDRALQIRGDVSEHFAEVAPHPFLGALRQRARPPAFQLQLLRFLQVRLEVLEEPRREAAVEHGDVQLVVQFQ